MEELKQYFKDTGQRWEEEYETIDERQVRILKSTLMFQSWKFRQLCIQLGNEILLIFKRKK